MIQWAKDIASTGMSALSGLSKVIQPIVKWILKLPGIGFVARSPKLRGFVSSITLYKSGDIIENLGRSKNIKKSRQPNGFSANAKDNSADEIIPKAQQRAKRESKELANIAEFTSTSLKKSMSVASNNAKRVIDTNKKKLNKKSKKNTAQTLSDIKYQVNKVNLNKKSSSNIDDLNKQQSQINKIDSIDYKEQAVNLKNKDDQELLNQIDKKLKKQDDASKKRDKIVGSAAVAATTASTKVTSEKITETDKKTTQNLEKVQESVKKESESTRKMVAADDKNVTEAIATSSADIQETVVDNDNQILESNSEGLKALSDQLYNSEVAAEDARVEEIKKMNESDAKIDELIDSNNILYNTTRTLDRTNILLGDVVDKLEKPAGFMQAVESGVAALAEAAGALVGTIGGVLASVCGILGQMVGDVVRLLGSIVNALILGGGKLYSGLIRAVNLIPMPGSWHKALKEHADNASNGTDNLVMDVDQWLSKARKACAEFGASIGDKILGAMGIGGNQFDLSAGPAIREYKPKITAVRSFDQLKADAETQKKYDKEKHQTTLADELIRQELLTKKDDSKDGWFKRNIINPMIQGYSGQAISYSTINTSSESIKKSKEEREKKIKELEEKKRKEKEEKENKEKQETIIVSKDEIKPEIEIKSNEPKLLNPDPQQTELSPESKGILNTLFNGFTTNSMNFYDAMVMLMTKQTLDIKELLDKKSTPSITNITVPKSTPIFPKGGAEGDN